MSLTQPGTLARGGVRPGYRLGPYTLLEALSFGGQAVIWSAWDGHHERVVAIKLIPVARDDPWTNPENFEREVRLVRGLDHPNILPLYDFSVTGEIHFYSMRYIYSGSLRDLLESGPLSPPDALHLATQIASALEYIHEQGILHRDLKPSNILLDTRKRVYLTDFGLAKRLSPTTQALHTGHGTAPYSPPEQHNKSGMVGRSDIYSLGILLFEMLTGSLPWEGDPPLAIRQLATGEELPDPRDTNAALPSALVIELAAQTEDSALRDNALALLARSTHRRHIGTRWASSRRAT